MSSKLCQLETVNGKRNITDCKHEPRCTDTTKTSLEDLKSLIAEPQEHRDGLKDEPAFCLPFRGLPNER